MFVEGGCCSPDGPEPSRLRNTHAPASATPRGHPQQPQVKHRESPARRGKAFSPQWVFFSRSRPSPNDAASHRRCELESIPTAAQWEPRKTPPFPSCRLHWCWIHARVPGKRSRPAACSLLLWQARPCLRIAHHGHLPLATHPLEGDMGGWCLLGAGGCCRADQQGRSAIWLRHWAAYPFFSKNWESHSPSDLFHMSGKTTPWAHVQINRVCCLPVPRAGAGCKVQPAGFSSAPGTPQQPKGKGKTPPGLCQSAKSIPSLLAAGARPSSPGLSTSSHPLLRK